MPYGEATGPVVRHSGTASAGSTTFVVTPGAQVFSIQAYPAASGGTIQIFNDPAVITLPGTMTCMFYLDAKGKYLVSETTSQNIVFNACLSWVVEVHYPQGR